MRILGRRIYLNDLREVAERLFQSKFATDIEVRMSDDRPVTGCTLINGILYLSDDEVDDDEIYFLAIR